MVFSFSFRRRWRPFGALCRLMLENYKKISNEAIREEIKTAPESESDAVFVYFVIFR